MANVKDLLVNGSARVIGTIYGNATSANKVNHSLTFGSKSFNGSSAQTITLADLGGKPTQSAVSSPSASGTGISFIDTISQNANGVITATKKTVRDASASQSGLVNTGAQTFAGVKTFNNRIVLKDGNTMGAKIGAAYITTANTSNGEVVLQNGHLRFGGSGWDYNQWAGLKYDHSNKKIVLGLADGSEFTANSAQSGGTLKFVGISTIDLNKTASIKNLAVGGGIYWDPYVESASDASDAASITVLKSGVAGGTELRISQANDSNDVVNISVPTNNAARINNNIILNAANYTDYTVTKTGGGASGTWGINISGNATTATNADKLDGYHENSFLRYRDTVSGSGGTSHSNSLWSQIGIRQYNNALPDAMADNATYTYGAVISLPGQNSRLDIWYNHLTTEYHEGLRYRTGWNDDKKAWATILDSLNYNTIADGRYVKKTGDTMTGDLTAPSVYTSNWFRSRGSTGWYSETYGGGLYMTDSNFLRNYNLKAMSINVASNNAWGIGGHRLATVFKGNDHVSILLSTNSLGYGLCANTDGNWYWGKRTTGSETSTSGDSYILYGNTSHVSPYSTNTVDLGSSANRWRSGCINNTYSKWLHTNMDGSGSDGGITLYSGSLDYSILFRTTSNQGTHGWVDADWATYFLMNNTDSNRGWIFKRNGGKSIFSINTNGFTWADGPLRAEATGKDGFIAYPRGGHYSTRVNPVTGYLRIQLPVYRSTTMMKFIVDIYNYSENTSVSYAISGYNYYNGSWIACTAECLNHHGQDKQNLTVAFGEINDKSAIMIGSADTVWNYPQVQVRDVVLGFGNWDYKYWNNAEWIIDFSTSPIENITCSLSGTDNIKVSKGQFDQLVVINDSSNNSYDALAYLRNYSSSDWTMIIDKNKAYDYGLDIRASGTHALRVNGDSRFINSAAFGADVAPSYTVDVRGKIRSTDRIYANEWIQFDNYTGLYSPNNNAHFYPNNSTTYGQWKILGSKGGYSGIQLGDTTNYMTLMDDGVNKGLYQEGKGWIYYYNASNQRVGIRTSSLSGYAVTCEGDFYCNNGWLRTTGARGWYSETYGGGWYMSDSTYIRNYAGKTTRLDNLCLGVDNNSYRLYVNGTSYIQSNGSPSTTNGLTINNGVLAVTNYNQTLTVGALNGDWTHFQTSGAQFYFNKQIHIDGNLTRYNYSGTGYGTISGYNLAGNAATATKLATARTLTIGNTGKNFDGTTNVSWSRDEIGCAYGHYTTWDFTKAYSSQYVTFDVSSPSGGPGGWINAFVSTHGNYLSSFIANVHRTNDWYVGWSEHSSGTNVNPTWYKLLHTGNYTSTLDSRYVLKSGDTMTGALTINATTNDGSLKITSHGNTLSMGSMNTGYCHFQNSADIPFYFNKTIYEDGNFLPYQSNSFDLGNSSHYWRGLYASTLYGTSKDVDVASYRTTAGTENYILIKINNPSYYMTAFTVRAYQSYNLFDVTFSGYQYGGNYWYSPRATLGSDSTVSSLTVYFGYNSTTEMWVALPGMDYTGVKVINVVNGYQPLDIPNAFSITRVSSLPGTIQSTQTIYRPWIRGESVTGAVWNDYAEYREADTIQGGRCVREVGDDTLVLTTKRLMRGCSITSDTWGFAQGETDKAKTPIAVAGRVLAYPYEDRELFREYIGYSVCSGPDGTVSLMTEEEELKYPWAIVGTVSAVPDYEEWGGGEMADRPSVKVDGRIWIKVK